MSTTRQSPHIWRRRVLPANIEWPESLPSMGYAIAQKVGITMLGRASGRHYLAFTGKERLLRTTPQPTALA